MGSLLMVSSGTVVPGHLHESFEAVNRDDDFLNPIQVDPGPHFQVGLLLPWCVLVESYSRDRLEERVYHLDIWMEVAQVHLPRQV